MTNAYVEFIFTAELKLAGARQVLGRYAQKNGLPQEQDSSCRIGDVVVGVSDDPWSEEGEFVEFSGPRNDTIRVVQKFARYAGAQSEPKYGIATVGELMPLLEALSGE
ncbi:MAG: hypothetical protein HY513_01795 [Candidatus Aenigmarchaeota archaeon]|nr:hypothetical protein [Candidatus Aenigmarchaeota archaeon]